MFPFTTVLLILALALLCAYTLHKVRLMHVLLHEVRDQARQTPQQLFRQVEALSSLHLELGLARALPATRGWAASPDFLLAIAQHAQAAKPLTIVECGSGASTVVLARCLQRNGAGKLVSLEHDAAYAEQTRDELRRHGLETWAEVLHAPLQSAGGINANNGWPWYFHDFLQQDQPIDMLVIDGPPQVVHKLARHPAGPALFPRLSPGAAVFLDDAARPDEQATLVRWNNEFPQLRQSSKVCEKGCAVLTNTV